MLGAFYLGFGRYVGRMGECKWRPLAWLLARVSSFPCLSLSGRISPVFVPALVLPLERFRCRSLSGSSRDGMQIARCIRIIAIKELVI